MAAKKPAAKAAPKAKKDTTNSIKAAIDASRATGAPATDTSEEQQPFGDDGSGPEPHEINSALASPRMRALLEDQRATGGRPPKGG